MTAGKLKTQPGFAVGVRFTAHSPAPGVLVLRVIPDAPPAPDPDHATTLDQSAKLGS